MSSRRRLDTVDAVICVFQRGVGWNQMKIALGMVQRK
jgi:hypothetical protein